MKFSIITICYNEEKRIKNTLESIYNQVFWDYEHVVEDGGSTDSTLQIIAQFSEMHPDNRLRVYSEKDNGLYDAMNRALARAKGEYICFINSGDFLFDENTLKNVAEQIDMAPGMDWYYGACIVIFPNGDEYLQIPTSIENIEGRDMTKELKENSLRLNHQTLFTHKRCYIGNKFDISYRLRAELKWYYKCLIAGRRVKRLDFPVCKYTQGGFSERAASVALHAKETRRIFEELQLLTIENEQDLPREDNYSECCKNIYNQWLALHQAGLSVSDYLRRKSIQRIAIYGYAEFGAHLVNELKNTDIEIVCLIDRQDRFPFSGIKVVKPYEFNEKVDLVIITAVLHYKEIRESMSEKIEYPMMPLEDLLEDMWE